MGNARSFPVRPLATLWICAVLALTSSLAAAGGGTLDDGISAYDGGDYRLAFEILDDLALDADPTALAKAGRMYELGRGMVSKGRR